MQLRSGVNICAALAARLSGRILAAAWLDPCLDVESWRLIVPGVNQRAVVGGGGRGTIVLRAWGLLLECCRVVRCQQATGSSLKLALVAEVPSVAVLARLLLCRLTVPGVLSCAGLWCFQMACGQCYRLLLSL